MNMAIIAHAGTLSGGLYASRERISRWEAAMWSRKQAREMVHILMESRCYFGLDLRERYILIRYLLTSHQSRGDQDG
jgi:hypothetical protein